MVGLGLSFKKSGSQIRQSVHLCHTAELIAMLLCQLHNLRSLIAGEDRNNGKVITCLAVELTTKKISTSNAGVAL